MTFIIRVIFKVIHNFFAASLIFKKKASAIFSKHFLRICIADSRGVGGLGDLGSVCVCVCMKDVQLSPDLEWEAHRG